jgi:hypothetical protein
MPYFIINYIRFKISFSLFIAKKVAHNFIKHKILLFCSRKERKKELF